MSFDIIHLTDVVGWSSLTQLLAERQTNQNIVSLIILQLKEQKAVSALVEHNYVDRDFSEAYSAYYAKTFRRHSKLCKRVLVFGCDISFLNTTNDVRLAGQQLKSSKFLGQIVLRPISRAPLGQAILAAPPAPAGYDAHLQVSALYHAHVFGAELEVRAAPMTQQDSRIGACAQATIWVAARHFHARHRGPWLSTVSITQAAIANAEFVLNRVLPAGSEFLTLNNMAAALRAADREPLIYTCTNIQSPLPKPAWKPALRPKDVIARYLDSGIPVIIGLVFPGQDIGHAIIATGQIVREQAQEPLPQHPTIAEYNEAFVVNDDQLGPNAICPVDSSCTIKQTSYSINDNAMYLMIPLPKKVFLPAETAELLSWSALDSYKTDWAAFKARHAGKLGVSEQLGDALILDILANKVLARTYLTYGWKYKTRAISNKFSNSIRQAIRNLDVPRFVYVTEFSRISDTTAKSRYERRIIAHCVVDATAKHQDIDSVLLTHAPGFIAWYAHTNGGDFIRSVAPVADSALYYPKARGEQDFANFEATEPATP